jgi:hypothetical protein
MDPILLWFDPYLIWLYRLTGWAWADYFLGTWVLAWLALVVGELTISLAFLAVKRQVDRVNQEAQEFQNLSIQAAKAGDKPAFEAANKVANDAFGKSFFMQIALSAAFLWPIPFALAWMQYRFIDITVPLPLLPWDLGYAGVFIALYIAAYFIFKRFKYRLPYFRRIKVILDSYKEAAQVAP